jgi:hypothetical protein
LDELAKTWPLYLNQDISGQSAYWCSITESIKEHLCGALVIKNRTGRLSKPRSLMFLDWAHDRNGEPMFGHMHDYVSPDYPNSVRDALVFMGVKAPDWRWVCDKLQELHDKSLLHSKTRMQNRKWCSDLAKVILEQQELRDDKHFARDLSMIPLIPLANKTWRCPPSEDDPIYFPASLGTTIPPGLPLSLVDEKAYACHKRKKLFQLLGVKDCDVPDVVERILDHHTTTSSVETVHLIAQLKYLYKMRKHLGPGDMDLIYFDCSSSNQKGTSIYADISDAGELQQLFSGYSEAYFLNGRYFAGLKPSEKTKLAEWLGETASVALAPRFITTHSYELHRDFKWLLDNKSRQILAILHQHWNLYSKEMKKPVRDTLADHMFMCESGRRAALRKTYIPFAKLVNMTQSFGNAKECHFLALPSGDPDDWIFLSSLGVGLDDGLDFYLWVLKQSGFKNHTDVDKSKQLYLAIQSRILCTNDEEKVK